MCVTCSSRNYGWFCSCQHPGSESPNLRSTRCDIKPYEASGSCSLHFAITPHLLLWLWLAGWLGEQVLCITHVTTHHLIYLHVPRSVPFCIWFITGIMTVCDSPRLDFWADKERVANVCITPSQPASQQQLNQPCSISRRPPLLLLLHIIRRVADVRSQINWPERMIIKCQRRRRIRLRENVSSISLPSIYIISRHLSLLLVYLITQISWDGTVFFLGRAGDLPSFVLE